MAVTGPTGGVSDELSVFEYIGSMARELAEMARMNGDPELGDLLDEAASRVGPGQGSASSELPA